jgi:hypothetical protein
LKSNGTHRHLVYADDVNKLIGSLHIVEKNTDGLAVASKENGLEVNVDKTKYMVMFRDRNGGLILNMKIDNSSFFRVEEFKYLRKNLRNKNSIQEEFKSSLKSGNACCYSV